MHEGKPMLNKNGIPRIHPYEEEMKKKALEKSLENNSKKQTVFMNEYFSNSRNNDSKIQNCIKTFV